MSFFGFDTSLPSRDRAGEREDAAGLGGGLGASAQEDVEVYTWGEEAYDDLADRLQEDGDDFNQDTFGDEEIDNQFDFMGQTAAQASVPPQQQQQQRAKSGRNEDKFKSSNLDDFWGAPNSGFGQSGGLGNKPTSYDPFGGVSLGPVPGLAPPSSYGQFNSGQSNSNSRPALTLEEVEAELRASRSQQQQPPPQAAPLNERRALTLEEVEAQMLAQRSSQPQPPQVQPQGMYNDFPPQQFQGLPPHIANLLAQQPPNLNPEQREQLLGIQLQQMQQSGTLGGMGMGMQGPLGGMGMNGGMPMQQGMRTQQPPIPSETGASSSPAPHPAQAQPQVQAPQEAPLAPAPGTPKGPSGQHKPQQPSNGTSFLTNPSHFPPLGTAGAAIPTGPSASRTGTPAMNPLQQLMNGSAQAVGRGGPGGLSNQPVQLNNPSHASAAAAILQAQAAQAQNMRMSNLLNSIPNALQARVLSVPPYVQFETLDLVIRNVPQVAGLSFDQEEQKVLNSHIEEGRTLAQELQFKLQGTELDQIEKVRVETVLRKVELLDEANRIVDSILKREDIRKRIAAKIQGMSRYNNLMSNSDKDFITRIQVSQLVTPDPYADDFYAHIYFALRGGGPGAAVAAASAGITSGNKASENEPSNDDPPKGPRRGRGRQQRGVKARETAMQRMQAQVERLVANRKIRDGERESASLAAAAGASLPSEEGKEKKDSSSNAKDASPSPSISNLGKVAHASSKGPRQLLQISAREVREERLKREGKLGGAVDDAATEAVRAALAGASLGEGAGRVEMDGGKKEPLTRFETMRILEKLYDTVLALEQMRRTIPQAPISTAEDQDGNPIQDPTSNQAQEEYEKQSAEWQTEQEALVGTLWSELRVLEPLEISNPHPFVSLLSTSKGKRLFPRALRHLSPEQVLTALTMIVASFDSLDVVKLSGCLDLTEGGNLNEEQRTMRMEAQRQTEAFATSIIPVMLSQMANAPMRIVCGMLALFVERNNIFQVARTKPGIALLTMFLSRGELLRQGGSSVSGAPTPTPEELDQWVQIFSLLFARLSGRAGSLVSLFPSTRVKEALPFGQAYYHHFKSDSRNIDLEDEPVWNLMATLAVSASMDQQHSLVQELREKILENVVAAKRERENLNLDPNGSNDPTLLNDERNDLRIRNVNLLLHALNLDASQITA